MLYTYPDYFKKFKCIADQCPDTCCAGWYIMIDEDSLENYKEYQGEYRDTLHKNIKWKDECFKQGKSGNCAFLREDLLCDMYIHLGENSLCKTCREYPRHTEEFENVREISLSLSCPVVAKMLCERMEKVTFYSEEKEEEEEFFEDYDNFFYDLLCDMRSSMITLLQDRTKAIDGRMRLVLKWSTLAQEKYEQGELALWEDEKEALAEDAAKEDSIGKHSIGKHSIRKKSMGKDVSETDGLADMDVLYNSFLFLYDLEEINPDWQLYLADAETVLFEDGEKKFWEKRKLFDQWWKESSFLPMDILMEQIVVYFLSVYLPGAVYDERIQGKVFAAVGHCLEVYLLLMAEWLMHGCDLQQEDMLAVIYNYSREIEHSDENLEMVEEFEWFS